MWEERVNVKKKKLGGTARCQDGKRGTFLFTVNSLREVLSVREITKSG